jgi:hypothetical protein
VLTTMSEKNGGFLLSLKNWPQGKTLDAYMVGVF